ncbi:hypothetical protein MD484_g1033, partial [Candolleomyces efflorescens]
MKAASPKIPQGKESSDSISSESSSSSSSSPSSSSDSSSSYPTPPTSSAPSPSKPKDSKVAAPPTSKAPQPDYSEAGFHSQVKKTTGPGLVTKIKKAAKEKGKKMTQKVENTDSKGRAGELPVESSSVGTGSEGRQKDRQVASGRSASETAADKGLGLPHASDLKITSSAELTDSERTMYASERLDNFRWLSKVAGRYAEGPPLTEKDLVDEKVAKEVSEIGQFAELSYSTVEVQSLFKHHAALKDENILLDYPVLGECDWVEKIQGHKMDLTAFVVFRRRTRQLVVSIAGSSNLKHAIQNLRAVRMAWRPGSSAERVGGDAEPPEEDFEFVKPESAPDTLAPPIEPEGDANAPTVGGKKDGDSFGGVHTGFFALYRDVKEGLEKAILKGIQAHAPDELVLTGHSMGGSVAYLLCLDLLSPADEKPKDAISIALPKKLCLTTFGAPRTGNAALVTHFRHLVDNWEKNEGCVFQEYSVKAFNDGVPAVPPRAVGYRHFCKKPFYAFRRKLYQVPEGQAEFSLFRVHDGLPGANPDKPNDSAAASSAVQVNADVDGSTIRSPISKGDYETPADWVEVAPGTRTTAGDTPNSRNSFPRGGHNYYNGRDLEAFRRTTDHLHAAKFPGAKWEERLRGTNTCASGVNR